MNKTIEVQHKTLEAMQTQVSETEKIGNIYRKLFEELPAEVEKWKVAVLKFKDERIRILEQANQNKDDRQTNAHADHPADDGLRLRAGRQTHKRREQSRRDGLSYSSCFVGFVGHRFTSDNSASRTPGFLLKTEVELKPPSTRLQHRWSREQESFRNFYTPRIHGAGLSR